MRCLAAFQFLFIAIDVRILNVNLIRLIAVDSREAGEGEIWGCWPCIPSIFCSALRFHGLYFLFPFDGVVVVVGGGGAKLKFIIHGDFSG